MAQAATAQIAARVPTAQIVRLRGRSVGGEQIVLHDAEEACAALQRLLFHPSVNFYAVANRAGVGASTVRKIAYGEVRSPHIRTCILIFWALGKQLVVVDR
jgi:hypothetical protein